MKPDEKDLKILEFLRKDARIPFTEIGDSLEITDSTVHMRVKKMIDEGVISGFTIKVNYEAMGKVSCLLMLDVVGGHFEEILPQLVQSGKVEEIFELDGNYMAALRISADSLVEIRDEVMRIRKIPKVTRTRMNTILKTWKAT
jgi:DNA-binding Lrp family transcriptional regulator